MWVEYSHLYTNINIAAESCCILFGIFDPLNAYDGCLVDIVYSQFARKSLLTILCLLLSSSASSHLSHKIAILENVAIGLLDDKKSQYLLYLLH